MIWNDRTISFIYFKHILELQLKLIISTFLKNHSFLKKYFRVSTFKKSSIVFISIVLGSQFRIHQYSLPMYLMTLIYHLCSDIPGIKTAFLAHSKYSCFYLQESRNLVRNRRHHSSSEINLVKADFSCRK